MFKFLMFLKISVPHNPENNYRIWLTRYKNYLEYSDTTN